MCRYVGRTMNNLYGPGSGQIWLDDVDCQGTENFTGYCTHSGWGSHDCTHDEDVSITCNVSVVTIGKPPPPMITGFFFVYKLSSNSVSARSCLTQTSCRAWKQVIFTRVQFYCVVFADYLPHLRLTSGSTAREGRLEILYNGEWGTVCDDGWTDTDATVACRMLGFMYVIQSYFVLISLIRSAADSILGHYCRETDLRSECLVGLHHR